MGLDDPLRPEGVAHNNRQQGSMDDTTQLTPRAGMAMVVYSIVSASMLLINKMCLHVVPLPGLVSVVQFVFAAVSIALIKVSGVAIVDDFEWRKVRAYLLYVGLFVIGIFTNMKSVQKANVETVIVFRACCPIVVSVLEAGFLGRQLPNARSACALLVIVLGALGYVSSDSAFKKQGMAAYSWVSAYTVVTAIQMAYGKYIVGKDMNFQSMWGPTQYTNVLSIPPMIAIALVTNEPERLPTVEWSSYAITLLSASCVVGLAISFTGWYCRALVTATCYTVLGVANKMLTVMANNLVWDQHASSVGILWLMVCLAGASGYKQAPMRDEKADRVAEELLMKPKPAGSEDDDDSK